MCEHPFSRVSGCRVSDALTYLGLRLVVMENELLTVVILPEKGAEILALRYKPKDMDPLLRLKSGLRVPSFYPPTISNSDGAFLDFYSGGWQELFPSGGGPGEVLGAELGRHGEVALMPWNWEIVEDSPERVAIRLWVRTVRMPFVLERMMILEPNQAILHLKEVVMNEGGEELAFMWGHHPALGKPFLDQSCILDVPAKGIEVHRGPIQSGNRLKPGDIGAWPYMTGIHGDKIDLRRVPGPGEGFSDMFYLTGLEEGWYAITNRNLGLGFAMVWDKAVFPVLWVWCEFGGSTGYPWYSNTYALGLEPFSSYCSDGRSGLEEAIKAGAEKRLLPGEKATAWLKAIIYPADDCDGVDQVTPTGEVHLR